MQLVARVLSGDTTAAAEIVFRPRTASLILTTAWVTIGVSVGCLVLGILIAWALMRLRLPGRGLWRVLVCLPLAVPSYVAAFAWVTTIPGLRGPFALMAVLILSTVPYVVIPTMAAFSRVDDGPYDVARTLGRGPLRAFLSVTLPQILPAAMAGTLLAALYTLADFGAPAMLRVDTLTTGIYAQFTGGLDRTLSAAMSLVLLAAALVCVWAERSVRRRAHEERPRSARRRPLPPSTRAVTLGASAGLSLLAIVGVGFPLGALSVRTLSSTRYGSEFADLAVAAGATLVLGAVAAFAVVILALPVGILAARYRSRFVAVIESVSYVGHAIPGIVVALALVALSLQFFPGAYQTTLVLLFAYMILFLPKAIGSVRASIAQVSPATEEVSRTLGVGRIATWMRITLRGAAPGVVAGFVLVMTSVMKELPATLMLRPIGLDTLATELWSKTSIGAYGAAAPIGLLLILVGFFPAIWMAVTLREEDE